MDAETVADLLGVSTRMLNNYINQKGLPSSGSGRARTFVWAEVLEWFVGYRLSLEHGDGSGGNDDADPDDPVSGNENIRQANLRKTRAEANLKELQLGRLRSEVISIQDAKVRLDRMMANLRARLLGMAPKLANRLEAERDRTSRESAIKDELETLCREISTGAIVDVEPDAEAGHDAEDTDVVDELTAAAQIDTHVLGHVFRYLSPRQAIAEANELVRAARDFRDQVKEYFRARHQ
jgi:hypothetical protein